MTGSIDYVNVRFEWGVRNTHPTPPTEIPAVGDRYYDDGTGVFAEGVWVYNNAGVWILLGGVGTVTSVAQGNGITCTPNPIVAAGTVAARYGNTATDVVTGDHDHAGAGGGDGNILPPTSMTDPGTLNPANSLIDDHVRDASIHNVGPLAGFNTPERPDAFHFIKNIANPGGHINETGFETQRCIAYSENYGNKYFLYCDSDKIALSPAVLQLRIEHQSGVIGTKTPLERCVWDVQIALSDYVGGSIDQINQGDFCLVIDDTDTLHVIFVATDNTDPTKDAVYDAYVRIVDHTVLQVPTYASAAPAPPPMQIAVQAEYVNTVHTASCSHPTAAFSTSYGTVSGAVCVVWKQTVSGVDIYTNSYDPTGIAGARYTTLLPAQLGVSNNGYSADWPTIEFGDNNAYLLYTEGNQLKFATSPNTVAGVLTWNIMAGGVAVSDYIVGCPATVSDPMSMVVATYTTDDLDICYVVVRDAGGQGEKVFLVIYGDFLTTGNGAAYDCSIYDTYTTQSPHNATGRSFFQLGISHIAWSSTGYAPVPMMLHFERDSESSGGSDTFSVFLTLFIPDLVEGIIPSVIPIHPSAASFYLFSNFAQISPKVHYAYYSYNRPWHHSTLQPYRYYPWMIYARLDLAIDATPSGSDVRCVLSLWSKDSPEYPYKDNVQTY